MKFSIVIYPDAEDELKELINYLNGKRSGAGTQLLQEYEKTLKFLEEFAEAIPKRNGVFRHVMIGKTQIMMVYRIDRKTVRIRKILWASRAQQLRYKR